MRQIHTYIHTYEIDSKMLDHVTTDEESLHDNLSIDKETNESVAGYEREFWSLPTEKDKLNVYF